MYVLRGHLFCFRRDQECPEMKVGAVGFVHVSSYCKASLELHSSGFFWDVIKAGDASQACTQYALLLTGPWDCNAMTLKSR